MIVLLQINLQLLSQLPIYSVFDGFDFANYIIMLSRVIHTAYVYYTALAAVFHSRLVHFYHDLSQFLYCVVKSFGLYDLYVNFGEAKSFQKLVSGRKG